MHTAHPSRQAPKCVDCRHHQVDDAFSTRARLFCNHPSAPIDLTTGELALRASTMRGPGLAPVTNLLGLDQLCGPEGRLFEPGPAQCSTCAGRGRIREPYAREATNCPDCLTRPISEATSTTRAAA